MPRLRIRHHEDEIELDGPDSFVAAQLKAFYSRIDAAGSSADRHREQARHKTSDAKDGGVSKKALSPAEFYKAKNRSDGVSQILIFAKYLEQEQGITEFTRQQLNAVATEAKLPKDIHTQYFTNAVKQGLLRGHGRGRFSLTISAEEVLSSM